MAKILLHHVGHRHPQASGEILHCHGTLFVRVLQELDYALCKSLSMTRRIELNCQLFTLCHLPEIGQVRTNNWNSIGAG
jgi:hypothetical protein